MGTLLLILLALYGTIAGAPQAQGPKEASRGARGYNRVLNRIANRNDHLRVVDWAAIAAHNRRRFGPDGVHPNATGYIVRARAIAKQVRRCRRSLAQ
jgi:hypothetical protein